MLDPPEFLIEPPSLQRGFQMNPVSDALHSMRLTGGIFLEARFTAPWAIRARVAPDDCIPFMQAPKQIIAYHLITVGRCVLQLEGAANVELKAGDLVLLPRNTPHILASTLDTEAVSVDQLIHADAANHGSSRLSYGGGGEPTQLICGFLGSASPNKSLFAMLPQVLTLTTEDWGAAEWIQSSLRFAIQESSRSQIDSRVAVAKLAEMLFFEAVRRYFELHPSLRHDAAAAMHDELIGRALLILQTRPLEHWTTESLAREIGLSRSCFADRFTRELGVPPMRYLASRRLEQASIRLLDPHENIGQIAYESGYESEAAFNRAFKRHYGAPPATWRRNMIGRN